MCLAVCRGADGPLIASAPSSRSRRIVELDDAANPPRVDVAWVVPGPGIRVARAHRQRLVQQPCQGSRHHLGIGGELLAYLHEVGALLPIEGPSGAWNTTPLSSTANPVTAVDTPWQQLAAVDDLVGRRFSLPPWAVPAEDDALMALQSGPWLDAGSAGALATARRGVAAAAARLGPASEPVSA
jgi:hypothetical protein